MFIYSLNIIIILSVIYKYPILVPSSTLSSTSSANNRQPKLSTPNNFTSNLTPKNIYTYIHTYIYIYIYIHITTPYLYFYNIITDIYSWQFFLQSLETHEIIGPLELCKNWQELISCICFVEFSIISYFIVFDVCMFENYVETKYCWNQIRNIFKY